MLAQSTMEEYGLAQTRESVCVCEREPLSI